jgi:hypothetical protein
VVLALLLSLGLLSLNGERKDINSVLKSVYGVFLVTLGKRAGNLALVEAVSVGEDLAVSANLYSCQFIPDYLGTSEYSH